MNVSPAMLEEDAPKRKTSFATLPTVTTTWQQQSANVQQMESDNNSNICLFLFNYFYQLPLTH